MRKVGRGEGKRGDARRGCKGDIHNGREDGSLLVGAELRENKRVLVNKHSRTCLVRRTHLEAERPCGIARAASTVSSSAGDRRPHQRQEAPCVRVFGRRRRRLFSRQVNKSDTHCNAAGNGLPFAEKQKGTVQGNHTRGAKVPREALW